MLGRRIKERRKLAKLTQTELGDAVGVRKNTVSDWERGMYKPDIQTVDDIARVLDVSAAYLLGFTDTPGGQSTSYQLPSHPDFLPVTTMRVPLLGSIACGEPIFASEDLSATMLVDAPIPCDFALRCKGDSMIDARILDGDLVFIRRQDVVDDGSIAAVLIDDEATLKRVYHLTDGRVELRAANARYAPIILGGENDTRVFRVIGKAVGFQSVFV